MIHCLVTSFKVLEIVKINISRGKTSNEIEVLERCCTHKLIYIQIRKKSLTTQAMKSRLWDYFYFFSSLHTKAKIFL